MNGAESLVRTLLASGIDTCFANPGTSEMHFVSALDRVEGMRCVLGLAETVVSGCADGYARMAGKPAATLLHCGPGLANALANVHNARRAFSPMVNIVGDHATYHRPHDAPLTADTDGLARATSHWVRTGTTAAGIAADGAAAAQAAMTPPGQIATLILPADTAWGEGSGVAPPLPVPPRSTVAPETLQTVARALRSGEPAMLVMSGQALTEAGLHAAHRIRLATGAQLRTPSQVARMARGLGRAPVDRIPYAVDNARKVLAGLKHVILVAAKPPTAFFAYPDKPSLLSPPDAAVHVLARPEQDAVAALRELADILGAPKQPDMTAGIAKPEAVRGKFAPDTFAATLATLLPEQCVVVEDAVTSGRALFAPTFGAAPHDWLQITGGAIGVGFPLATGAAIGAPGRKVVCLQADGAGMYAPQALWTQARERLDVVNVVFANRIYKILHGELLAVGAQPGRASNELFDLARPAIDWVGLATSLGVEATRVDSLEGFADVFRAACGRRGPMLIEFRIDG